MASRFATVTSEEMIQINFLGVYYLTVLVYTRTTIHLSEWLAVDIYRAANFRAISLATFIVIVIIIFLGHFCPREKGT